MLHFKTLGELHRFSGYPSPENPLISLLRCTNTCSLANQEFTGDFYMIAFKKMKSGQFLYGRTTYDHDSGSMYFTKPRQVIQMNNIELEEAGFCIYLHQDLLNGHAIHSEINKYHYFDYEVHEALHLSPREEKIIWELYRKIETEYKNNQDEYSRDIILSHIDSILKYSQRYYKRQFINRNLLTGKVVSKFNNTLRTQLEKGALEENGLPTVKRIADDLHMSTRYLSDLLKAETGKTAIELIHIFLIGEAKNLLRSADAPVGQIAYSLGFENLPYFSRLFKKETGMSPNQFKKQDYHKVFTS